MNAPTPDAATPPLVAETAGRYDLLGLHVINNATGAVETMIVFSRGEIDLLGYVEHVEKSYVGTKWSTVRVYWH